MDNPEQHGNLPMKGGTSGHKTGDSTDAVTKNGLKRDNSPKAATGGQNYGDVPDPGRSSRDDGSETNSRRTNNTSDFQGQKKRARRRKLGKALGKASKNNSAANEPQKANLRGKKHRPANPARSTPANQANLNLGSGSAASDNAHEKLNEAEKKKSKRKRHIKRSRHFARVAFENNLANMRAQEKAEQEKAQNKKTELAKNTAIQAEVKRAPETSSENAAQQAFMHTGFGFWTDKQNHSYQRPKYSPKSAQIARQVSDAPAGQQHASKPFANKPFGKPFAARPFSSNSMPLYAALDLGTNNCRLLIAAPTRPGQFKVVDAYSRIVRLGEGLSSTGCLSEEAMDRAIEALKICQDKLTSRTIRKSRLIATEACRAAANGEHFLQRVRDEAGLELEIVDRQTEARLAVSGCGTLIAPETEAIVLFDIGGGSSEIALIDVSKRRSPRLAEHIIAWTSLPVGVVTLAERFDGRNVTRSSFSAMVDHVSSMLSDFAERYQLGNLAKSTHFHLLGTSGTVTTLAGIHLGLERYDRRRVDGMWMRADDVTRMTQKLLSWDFDARVANPCIGSDRADLVLAGCAILDAIRNVWPSEKLLVADRGLREGILTELMSRDGVWRHQRSHTNYKYRQSV